MPWEEELENLTVTGNFKEERKDRETERKDIWINKVMEQCPLMASQLLVLLEPVPSPSHHLIISFFLSYIYSTCCINILETDPKLCFKLITQNFFPFFFFFNFVFRCEYFSECAPSIWFFGTFTGDSLKMCRSGKCRCGAAIFVRTFHTVIVLGVPVTLLFKDSRKAFVKVFVH